MPINWQDGAGGGTPLSAANLNRLAVVADIDTAGTPSGDAVVRANNRARIRDLSDVNLPGTTLVSQGTLLTVGSSGFDAGKVESPCVFLDPATGKLTMVYTGYTTTGATAVASFGLAYYTAASGWTKQGQFFTASGVAGAPDEKGVTGPVVVYDGEVFHLFYIGLTAVGYEAGQKTICHATASSLAGPWTRQGAIIGPAGSGWRSQYVWHPNLVQANGKWYLFFNATGPTGLERCGYATASSLSGPWTVDDANSPILPDAGHTSDGIWGGDPFVWREGDHWRMDFADADGAFGAVGNFWATTTDAAFPLGWIVRGQATDAKARGPFKPWITRRGGVVYHYGSDSSTPAGGILLAIGGQQPTRPGGTPVITGSLTSGGALQNLLQALVKAQAIAYVGAQDTFTRANATGLGTSSDGKTWTYSGGTGFTISNNTAVWTGAADGLALLDSGLTDHYTVEMDLVSVTGAYPVTIPLRYDAGSSYLLKAYWNNGSWALADGTYFNPNGGGGGVASGDHFAFTVAGSLVQITRNGALVASFTDAPTGHPGSAQGIGGNGGNALTVDNYKVSTSAV